LAACDAGSRDRSRPVRRKHHTDGTPCAGKQRCAQTHAKTHKCAEIARRQIAAGAIGICVAKLGEAEALADAGIGSILITSPIVTERGIERLIALNARVGELMAVCDNPVVAERLAAAAVSNGRRLGLVVDIDPGMGRTGLPAGDNAAALVHAVACNRAFVFKGLQCYAGNLQHLESANERRAKSLSVLAELDRFCGRLRSEDIRPEIVTGAGTGTFDIDPDARILTEIQVGSYIFMDRQYNEVWEKSGAVPPFATSLFLQTTVISANRAGLATTDAGFKAFATDAGSPVIASGAPAGSSYFFFGDEQGGIEYPSSDHGPRPGDVVTCAVPHCDPTVNLHDCYHLVRGDRVEAIWPIEARGSSA
jgi:D-serine deaminase-like pyridoxal phosphate-dependent protein